MNKCYKHTVDQKKPDTKEHILYTFIYIKLKTGEILVLEIWILILFAWKEADKMTRCASELCSCPVSWSLCLLDMCAHFVKTRDAVHALFYMHVNIYIIG